MEILVFIGIAIITGLGVFFAACRPQTDDEIHYIPLPKKEEPIKTEIEQKEPIPEIETVIIEPKPKSMLETFCTAIRDYEGSPGDLNYRNNNPGNCRCSPVGYLPKYGKVVCVNGFAKFPTYKLGWEYLMNMVNHRATQHPEWTIRRFFEVYAPSADDNNPDLYAKFVAKRCGVGVDTTLAELFS